MKEIKKTNFSYFQQTFCLNVKDYTYKRLTTKQRKFKFTDMNKYIFKI